MPYGIQNRDYYGSMERGRVDADQAVRRKQVNALGQLDVQQAQRFNALAQDPNATAEQFARTGRTDVANYMVGRDNAVNQQRQEAAKFLYQAAQYGIQSGKPKAFIEQNYPQLAQMYGPDWATATDEQVKAGLQDALGRFGPVAGIAPEKPKEPGLINTIGPDGKPVRGLDGVGVPVYERPRTSTTVRLADGTEVQIGGDGVPQYGGMGLDKANTGRLQEAFINSQGNSYALREQMAKFKPEYATYAGQAKAGIAGIKEKIGMENAPQQEQYLAEYTAWKSDTLALLSQYLNQLSGAAISPHEETRLKGGFPNADDGPTQYKAKAEATLKRFALVQARAAYLLSNPNQSLDSVSLDSMSNIIALEANRLAKSLQKGGMTEEQAKQEAIMRTNARFFGNGQ